MLRHQPLVAMGTLVPISPKHTQAVRLTCVDVTGPDHDPVEVHLTAQVLRLGQLGQLDRPAGLPGWQVQAAAQAGGGTLQAPTADGQSRQQRSSTGNGAASPGRKRTRKVLTSMCCMHAAYAAAAAQCFAEDSIMSHQTHTAANT
jgi:hypothetical protein